MEFKFYKELECPHCHKDFKIEVNSDIITETVKTFGYGDDIINNFSIKLLRNMELLSKEEKLIRR